MWHVTHDMWHVTCDMWREVNILKKFQGPSSYGLGVMMSWKYLKKKIEIDWNNQIIMKVFVEQVGYTKSLEVG